MEQNQVFVPMLIEYEQDLEPISAALAEVLRVRLARYGVEVAEQPVLDKIESSKQYQWSVTLRQISERHLIITIDSIDHQRSVSEVRTVSYNPDVENLAWTMALVVEETVTPYLQSSGELPALGAGLAILEPREVAGTKLTQKVHTTTYPRFLGIGLGLTVSGVWAVDEILTGPKMFIRGKFSRRTVATFALGWQGSARYEADSVVGSLSQIPIELYVGSIFFKQRVLRIIGWAGFSLGFSVYRTTSGETSRTDMTFQPGGNFLLEFIVPIVVPLEFFFQGGCHIPFLRDVLVNNGVEVYSHVWVMPTMTVGLQLGF